MRSHWKQHVAQNLSTPRSHQLRSSNTVSPTTLFALSKVVSVKNTLIFPRSILCSISSAHLANMSLSFPKAESTRSAWATMQFCQIERRISSPLVKLTKLFPQSVRGVLTVGFLSIFRNSFHKSRLRQSQNTRSISIPAIPDSLALRLLLVLSNEG